MRILVTGGAGFIGSHLIDRLLKEKNIVCCVDDLSLGNMKNIDHNLSLPSFSFKKGDILDSNFFLSAFKTFNPDMVYHLAANSDIAKSAVNPQVDIDRTLRTTIAVLEAMRLNNVKRVFFASTSAIYGAKQGDIAETAGPLEPLSHYGACKLGSEALLSSYRENYKFQVWIARFPNVIGPRSTHGVIYDFVRKLLRDSSQLVVFGDGTQKKPYLHVFDLIEAIQLICSKATDSFNVFNVGVDSATSVSEIAQMVISNMKLSPVLNYTGGSRGWVGDVPFYSYDISKITALGWKSSMSSTQAVDKSIKSIILEQMK